MVVTKHVQKGEVGYSEGLLVQPLLLRIPEVAVSLRLSRAEVYKLISIEGLPVVRFGRAVRVSVISLQRWLEEREKGV